MALLPLKTRLRGVRILQSIRAGVLRDKAVLVSVVWSGGGRGCSIYFFHPKGVSLETAIETTDAPPAHLWSNGTADPGLTESAGAMRGNGHPCPFLGIYFCCIWAYRTH